MRAFNFRREDIQTQRHTIIAFASVVDIFIRPARSFVFRFVKNPPFSHRARGSESQIFVARIMKIHVLTNAKSLEYFTCFKTQLHFYIPYLCSEVQRVHIHKIHMYYLSFNKYFKTNCPFLIVLLI